MDYYKKPNELQVDLKEGRYAQDITGIRGILGNFAWIRRVDMGKESAVFYGQTYLMVKYLFDKYGRNNMYDFVMSLKNNDFEKAFVTSFGMSEAEFHREFINYIQNYRTTED